MTVYYNLQPIPMTIRNAAATTSLAPVLRVLQRAKYREIHKLGISSSVAGSHDMKRESS